MRNLAKRTDQRLLAAARKGEAEAFAVFYRRYRDLVLAYFSRRVRDPELAADLMMETFAAALSGASRKATAKPAEPAKWLFGIARNKLIDSYRRGRVDSQARTHLGFEPVYLDDVDIERINELTDEDRILGLLQALPRGQREAIRARVLHDRDYDDIAGEMGSSALVVRQRVSRGLRELRSAVEETE
jgi:RNA polymerase sigma factor (sigma-70 family)